MAAFTIPSIFTAIDKLSAPVRNMGRNVEAFASKAETAIARHERAFRKLTPALSSASKQFLSFASTAVVAGSIVSGVNFSIQSLKEYETSVASFRTIVSDLSDKDFSKFQNKINEVAKDTKKSSIDVASSFEKIAGLNAKFAETADGLGAVSKAAITLSKASGAELGSSAENLVGIMNQFSLGALEADRAINVLAAGQAVGAANIRQTSEAFVNFGSVAAGANISLEQSVALVQTLGKFSLFGAEAGTKLRGSVLKLQQAGVGYKSGQFQINDALAEAKAKIDKLSTAKQKDAALNKIFGAENISTGRILLNNIDLYKEFAKGVTGTNEAQKAAEINSQSLTVALAEAKSAWINMITGSDKATSALTTAKKAVQFVTRNLDKIVSIGTKVLLFFATWKVLLLASKIAMIAYNVVLGIMGALSSTASIAIGANSIALGAYNIVTWLATTATSAFAFAMAILTAPITLIILAILALIAVVVIIIKYWNEWGAALALVLGPLTFVISLIQSFRRNWDMISAAFKTGSVLEGFKAIGATILDAILMPLQQIMQLIAKFTGWDWASSAATGLEKFRKDMGVNVTTDESGNKLPGKELINPEAQKQEALVQKMEATNNARVDLTIHDPNKRASVKSESNFVKINTSSTMAWGQ